MNEWMGKGYGGQGRCYPFPIPLKGNMALTSKVKGFEGRCKPTWLNTNMLDARLSRGVTGFFKRINRFGLKVGEEFHGIIREGGIIESTEGIYNA